MTPEFLREKFIYDKRGFLIRRSTRKRVGNFTHKGHGYKVFCINYKKYLYHRIVFAVCKGYFPKFIDHKDRCRTNNKIENLRESSKQLNCFNRGKNGKTFSGIRGLDYKKSDRKWRARVVIDGKSMYLGTSKNKNMLVKKLQRHQKAHLRKLISRSHQND